MRARSLVIGVVIPGLLSVCSLNLLPAAQGSLLSPKAALAVPPGIPTEVLSPSNDSDAVSAPPVPASFTAALNSALSAPALGRDVTGQVIDSATGEVLYSKASNRPQHPASTIKILTAMTILKALGPDTRLSTTVSIESGSDRIVLHGGGDSTLARVQSPAASWPAGQSARPATLSNLATQTAAALHKVGIVTAQLGFDDSLFVGSPLAPGWKPSFVVAGVVSPVMALSADGGRTSASSNSRSQDPAKAAAEYFAGRLRELGIRVAPAVTRVVKPAESSGVTTPQSDSNSSKPTLTPSSPSQSSPSSSASQSSTGPVTIASVQSPPIADLVERMLTRSDDDLAEALGHLAGGRLAGSASFEGGVRATKDTLEHMGLSTEGMQLADASGLSSLNEIDSGTFTRALTAVIADKPFTGSNVGTLWPVASGLPVAGLTGTLSDRFYLPKHLRGRGIVRAKTGTLTGVIGLAGMVQDAHGRVLIFDFDADQAPGPIADARAAVDHAASIVAAN